MIKKTVRRLIPGLVKEFLLPRIYTRQCHVYCVGAMKTGTHSLAGLFQKNFRADHEPERAKIISTALSFAHGKMSKLDLQRFIQKRYRRVWLDMDSSVFNYPFAEIYQQEFPAAKFILTIRDCHSWLDSCFNHQLSLPIEPEMRALLLEWFQPHNYEHTKHEQPLIDKGLYPLACYIEFWSRYNSKIIDIVSADRLMVLRTSDIADSLGTLEDFLCLPAGQLDINRSHSFRTTARHGVMAELDQQFVTDMISETGGKLMSQYFSS